MAAEWYFRAGADEFGPISGAELLQQVARGRIGPATEVRKGDTAWVPASKVAGLFDRAAQVQANPVKKPPPLPTMAVGPSPVAEVPPMASPTSIRYEVLDSAEADGFRVEVLVYPQLGGAKDHQTAATVYFANQAGIRLKQVRITLDRGEAIAESGALHFLVGQIDLDGGIGGVAGIGKAMVNKFVTREAAVLPRYKGSGQVYLEPSFSHFLIYQLRDEEIIADKGMFYCGQGGLDVGAALQRNVSSALFGGEGLFQTRVKGTGIAVFESPVPVDEVMRIDLKDETLRVDGNFALMRTGRIEFSVERSSRGLVGSLTSGEGLLQTFRGVGSVWLAPTQDVYQRLRAGGVAALGAASRSSNTLT